MGTFIAQKILSTIANFLRQGGVVNSSTTMNNIIVCVGIASGTTTTSTLKATAPIKLSPAGFPSDARDVEEKERDEELFNAFKNSLYDKGKAYNVITQSLKGDAGNDVPPSGRIVWKTFLAWCSSGGS
eukprot:15366178-Ditylum_brightwellii.AAC.1